MKVKVQCGQSRELVIRRESNRDVCCLLCYSSFIWTVLLERQTQETDLNELLFADDQSFIHNSEERLQEHVELF